MKFEFVERHFSYLFSVYIGYVSAHSVPFFLVPLIVSGLLSTGILLHPNALIKDDILLYTPTNAKARQELHQLESLFSINDSDPFYINRRYDMRRMGYIIVTGKNDSVDILDPDILFAALSLWNEIQTIQVEDESVVNELTNQYKQIGYRSICVKLPLATEFRKIISAVIDQLSTAKAEKFVPRPNYNKTNELCVSNPLLELLKYLLSIESKHFMKSKNKFEPKLMNFASKITTNAMVKNSSEIMNMLANFQRQFSGRIHSLGGEIVTNLFGGIMLDEKTKQIIGAKAIMLPYALRHTTPLDDRLAEKWELKLASFLNNFRSRKISTTCWTYETLNAESALDREHLKKMFLPCFLAVSIFTIVQCCVLSWRRSHPFLALGGVICAAMSITSGIGLLLHFGLRMTSIAYSMPFIVFSVSVDNVFILLSTWRTTNPNFSLEERLSRTYADAAVSITITSLTDVISYAVGCFTPFPSVQIFCIYAVVAVSLNYFYQLTFLAAIMYWSCLRETQNRHCLFFTKLKSTENAEKDNNDINSFIDHLYQIAPPPCYNASMDWGMKKQQIAQDEFDNRNVSLTSEFMQSYKKNNCISQFFYSEYSGFIRHPCVRLTIFIAFIGYLFVAGYGCMHLKFGLEPYDLLPKNSYGKTALEMTRKYFTDNGGYLHVWMYNLSTINYGHRRLWIVLDKEIELYEYTEFTSSADSWLRAFLEEQNSEHNLIDEQNFVPHLINFLKKPQNIKYNSQHKPNYAYMRYKLLLRDILFTKNMKKIVASRVTIRLRFIDSKNQSRAMSLFRRLAESSALPTGFAEQYDTVLPGTISSIALAALAVVIVSLLLIPEPSAAFWVLFTILSINVGVLGFMTFWSIRLDFISMVTIVMSIGFCVDFAAHLSYNYARYSNATSDERMRCALYTVGTPILQSAASTILGVLFMLSTESYVFCSFIKTIVLVIVLGVLHGLVILPVLLITFDAKQWTFIEKCQYSKSNNNHSNNFSTKYFDALKTPH